MQPINQALHVVNEYIHIYILNGCLFQAYAGTAIDRRAGSQPGRSPVAVRLDVTQTQGHASAEASVYRDNLNSSPGMAQHVDTVGIKKKILKKHTMYAIV